MNQPQPVQLDGNGPFLLPTCEGFLGLAIAQGRLPVQIRLVTQGGSELHIPVEPYALKRLYGQLKAIHEKKPEDDQS